MKEMEKRSRKVQYLAAVCVSMATITMGMTSAWHTPVILKFHENTTQVEIDKNEIAWMLSTKPIGFIVGSLVTGAISDRIGRRVTILWSALPFTAGMIAVCSATQPWMLYVVTFLWSCGTGILSTVMNVYFSEISEKEIRGRLSITSKYSFNLGLLIMMLYGPLVSYRTLNYILSVAPVCYFIACLWIPESPYYLLKEGRCEAAKLSLMRLRGYQDNESAEEELQQMKSQVNSEMRRSGTLKELFGTNHYRKAIIIASGLKITQIMTGGGTIQQYLGVIMKESGINTKVSTIIIIFGAVTFFVSIMPSILVDKLGRRPLLIWSYIGTGISLTTVGIYFSLMEVIKIDRDSITPYGVISFGGIICANIISTIGFQSLIHVIPGEIFPTNVRAVAMTSLNIFGGILGFAISRGYQALKDLIGLCGVFWVFSAIAFIGAIFSILVVPETKGKSLKEIQDMLGHVSEEEVKLNQIGSDNFNGNDKETLKKIDESCKL